MIVKVVTVEVITVVATVVGMVVGETVTVFMTGERGYFEEQKACAADRLTTSDAARPTRPLQVAETVKEGNAIRLPSSTMNSEYMAYRRSK